MVGGDEGDAGAPRRNERAPGGGAAAGMDQIDVLTRDETGERVAVGDDAGRVLGGGGERHHLAAERGDTAGKASALGQDQRPATGLDDGGGDLERGDFGPTGVEMGDQLQYGRAGCGHGRAPAGRRVGAAWIKVGFI